MDSERWHRDNAPAARNLRRTLTRSEELLWERLRARRFHGLKVRRQHPVGGFVLDFYCEDLRLAIEVDGGSHDDPTVRNADRERQLALEGLGTWSVRIRAEATEAQVHSVLAEIEQACGFV